MVVANMALFNRLDIAALFFFCVVQNFVAIDTEECSTKCDGDTQNLEGFLKGHSYTYTFNGLSEIHLSGAHAQVTSAALQAVATVYSLGDCSHILKITDLAYIGPSGTIYEGPQEISKPVRFSIKNGSIGTEICTEKGDSQNSLNIKRAIISMLNFFHESSEKENIEVDIFGQCPTTYFVDGNFIQKRKILNTCKKRLQTEENFLRQFHNAESTFKTGQVMESHFKIDMKINSGILEKAASREDYFFLPFSSKRAGAKATVTSRLRLTDTAMETFEADCNLSKSIIFESRPIKASNGNDESIHSALLLVTKHLEHHVQPESPSVFIDLIRLLKSSHMNDMVKVFDIIENEKENINLMRKVFIDALVRTATSDSIQALIQLIKRKLDPVEKQIILSSFSAVKHVTFNTVKAVTGLLTLPDLPYDAYLSVSAIAGSYCKEYSCYSLSKSKRGVIVSITDFLVPKLQNCNADSRENETKIVSALRALKNINHIEDQAVNTLIICAIDKTISLRIRAAALETFTADPCLIRLKLVSLGILKDVEEDSELRIKAYLALLQCPSTSFVTVVQNILDHPNPSLQVGSFIASSLKNILDSNDPSREETRQLFNGLTYKNSFPVDARKYSQAYEMNFNNKDFGAKSSIQSNVIYSQNSFMPKSFNMNITANIFGMDVNLLEIGFRQGNLDRVLEGFFGPEGKFQTYSLKTMYDNFRQSAYNAYDKIRERMKRLKYRSKRDIQNQIANIGKKLKTNIGKYDESLDIDIYLKMFGSESVFLSLGESPDSSFEAFMDKFVNSISSTSGDKFMNDFRIHSLFLDTELTYPTMTGMALKLNIEGSSAGKVTFDENFNIRQLFGDAPDAKFEFKLMPSASIQIVGSLSTDADAFSTGMKVVTTLHSSTGIDLSGELINGIKGFKTGIAFPLERQELLTATSDIMFFTRKQGENATQKKMRFHQHFKPPVTCIKRFQICIDSDESWIDLFFGKRNLNKPAFLLNGHKKLIVSIPTPINIKYVFNGTSGINGKIKFWKATFWAQDPTDDTGMIVRFDTDDNELFSLKTLFGDPMQSVLYKCQFMNTPVEKSLTIIRKDHPDLYTITLKIGVTIEQFGSKTAYRPMIDISERNIDYLKTEGIIYLEQNGGKYKYNIDNFGFSTHDSKVYLNGWSIFEPSAFSWFMNLTIDDENSFWSNGKVFQDDDESLSNINVDFQNDYEEKINFWFEQTHNTTRDSDGSLHFDGKYVFIHGSERNTKTKIITYNSQSTIDNNKEFIYHFKHELTYPYQNLKHRGEIEYKDEKKINLIFYAEFEHNKIDLIFVLGNSDTNDHEKYATLKVIVNKLGGELALSIKNESEEKTKILLHMLVLPNDKYEVDMLIETKSIADDNEVVLFGHLQFPNIEIFLFDIGLILTPKLIVSHVSVTRTVQKFFDFDTVINLEMNFGKMTMDINGLAIFKGVYKIEPPQGKLIASLNAELLKFDRVIQFETECTYRQPNYTAEMKIFTDYSKDMSQVYRINTFTLIKNSNVELMSVLSHEDKQTKFNFIIKQIGNAENGRMKLDVELVPPSGVKYILIYDREKTVYDSLSNSTIDFILQKTDVNALGPIKFTTQLKKNNYNEKRATGYVCFIFTFMKENGDDVIYSLQTFIEDSKKKKVTELTTNLAGSMVKNKIDLYWWLGSRYFEVYTSTSFFEYKIRANYGNDTSICGSATVYSDSNIQEKYDVTGEIEAHLPINNFKTIKVKTKNHAKLTGDYSEINERALNFLMDAAVNNKSYFYDYKLETNDTFFSTSLRLDLPDNDPFEMTFSKNFFSTMKHDRIDYGIPPRKPHKPNLRHQHDADIPTHETATHNQDKNITTDIKFSASLFGQNVNYTLRNIRLFPLGSGGEFQNVLILPKCFKYKVIKLHCDYNTHLKKFRFTHDLDIDEKYNFTVNIDIDTILKSTIDLKSNFPDCINRRFFLKAAVESNELQIFVDNWGDFNLILILMGEFKSAMDLNVKMDIDCPKWHMVKYHFEAVNALSQSGDQALKVTGSENGSIFLNLSATLNETRDDESVFISGHGLLAWKSITELATFTYTQCYRCPGVDIIFDANVGNQRLYAVHINTGMDFELNAVQCDSTSTDCARFYMTREFTWDNHKTFNLVLDLKPYGYNTRYNLSTDVDDNKETLSSYKVNLNLERNGLYYNWFSNGSLIDKTYKMFTNIEIPSRNFSTETILSTYSAEWSCNRVPMVGEIIVNWNASSPDTKTHLKAEIGCHEMWKHNMFFGSIYFICPDSPREMAMRWKSEYDDSNYNSSVALDLDIFKLKEQRISFSGSFEPHYQIHSEKSDGYNAWLKINGEGHRVNYDIQNEVRYNKFYNMTFNTNSQLSVENQKNHHRHYLRINSYKNQELIIEAPVGNLVNFTSMFTTNDINWRSSVHWNANLKLFEDMNYYGEGKFSILDIIQARLETGVVGTAELMFLEALYKPREEAVISNVYKSDGKSHDLFKIGYKRPDNAIAISVSEVNEDQMKSFMETSSDHMNAISSKLLECTKINSEMIKNFTARLANVLAQSISEIYIHNFQSELKAIAQEVTGDEVLSLTEIPCQILLTASNALIGNTINAVSKISFLVMGLVEDLNEGFNRFLFTSVTETMKYIETVVVNTFNAYLVHSSQYLTYVNNFINTYALGWIPIFDEVYIVACDVFKKLNGWISELSKYPEKVSQVAQSISDASFFRYIMRIDLQSVRTLLDNVFENILPDSELLNFRKLLIEFQEQVDSGKLFYKLTKIEQLISKGTSLITSFTNKIETGELSKYMQTQSKLSLYTKNLKTLVKATNMLTLLRLAYLDENTRLPNYNPTDAIPPHQLKGFIAGGQYIFSFDGRYLHFPNNCKYVVAQDAVDGNFSIILNVEQKRPKSVLLHGKEGNIVEVDSSGKLQFNGQYSIFPLVNRDVQGYREGGTFNLKSNHGVSIKCSENLSLCYFKISGYYHGKLQGLLGNGNNEWFDDLRLPNGEKTDSEKDFRKAYSLDCSNDSSSNYASKITASNSDSKITYHINNKSMPAICADIINNDSLFPYCRLVVDIGPYKMACSEAYKTASSPDAASYDACLIAKTYALSCKANGFPASVPDVCINCDVDGKEYKASEGEIKFEIPTTQADIVLIVDTAQPNENIFKALVTPMITKIVDELKKTKIDNVKLYLVGFSPNAYYPIYYDLEKDTLAGSTIQFGNSRKVNKLTDFLMNFETNSCYINTYMSEYSKSAVKKVDELISEFNMDSIRIAYYSSNDLPLRPNATKSIILVKSTPCVSAFFSSMAHKYMKAVMKDEGIVVHLISPVIFKNTNSDYKDYIGFNNHDVFMVNTKNKQRIDFEYEKDECVDFVLSINGNVYSSDIFNLMNTKYQERFVSLAAKTVARSMSHISYEKRCKCQMGLLETTSKMRCRTVSMTDNTKSRKLKKLSKNIDAIIGRFLLTA